MTIFASEYYSWLSSAVLSETHLYSVFCATIVKLVYGLEVADDNDPHVARMIESVEGLRDIISGRMLVQYLPILRHVPKWVPLIGSQLRELAVCRAAADEVKLVMFAQTQDDLASILYTRQCVPCTKY